MTAIRALIIDDDTRVADLAMEALTEAGIECVTATDGRGGLEAARSGEVDAVVLDVGLPDMDGFHVLRALRAEGLEMPVVMLTSAGDEESVLEGLRSGADDYVTKPFRPAELAARVEAIVRRAGRAERRRVRVDDLELDVMRRTVVRGGRKVPLTPTEFDLLRVLMSPPGRVVSRENLLAEVWDIRFDPGTNLVDVHVSRLRSKLELGGGSRILHTVRGRGFRVGPAVAGGVPPTDGSSTLER